MVFIFPPHYRRRRYIPVMGLGEPQLPKETVASAITKSVIDNSFAPLSGVFNILLKGLGG